MTQENLCRNENIKKFDGFQTKNMNWNCMTKKQKKKLYTCTNVSKYRKKILNNFFEALKIDLRIV